MIELIEAKDLKDLYSAWQKIDERTKIHTQQIHELMRKIKEWEQQNKEKTT